MMSSPRSFVQIGAGNIGRSFLGQLFARGGYQVTFIDVDDAVINALNERGEYRVEIRDRRPETHIIGNVRGVNGKDVAAAVEALARCSLCATSVGQGALRFVYPTLAEAIRVRSERGLPPLDIIIAENIRDGAEVFRAGLTPLLPDGFDLASAAGLIETSIGKMVPIMSAEDRAEDPLLVFAEAYNTLICDARGFRNAVPGIPGLDAKQNIKAYVDRKSFIHNLGHALLAYFAYLEAPELVYTWEAVEHPAIGEATRRGMWESGRALIGKYPDEFTGENQGAHIEDLLSRFANKALGDTIYRVGRDITRKLSREDRVIGALLCDIEHGIEPRYTALCAAAGMRFRATDEAGDVFAGDAKFAAEVWPLGVEHIVDTVCGLAGDTAARAAVIAADERLRRAQAEGASALR
jgi:mannitol-1-phosphate 5-dehydrogenase